MNLKFNKKYFKCFFKVLFLQLILVSCSDNPSVFTPSGKDNFTAYRYDEYQMASEILAADYLIVMDYSRSFFYQKESLTKQLNAFSNSLKQKDIDYQIAVVNGMYQTNGDPKLVGKNSVGGIINKDTDINNFLSAQQSLVGGLENSNMNAMTHAGLNFLFNKYQYKLRQNAQLVIVYFSDKDIDWALASNATYVNEYRKYKTNPSYITSRAFLTKVYASSGSYCPEIFYTNSPGTKLSQFSNQLDSLGKGTNCLNQTDLSIWDHLARDIRRPTLRYKLRNNVSSNGINVYINNVLTTSGWSYSVATNELIFDSVATAPNSSDKLKIVYDPAFKLFGVPSSASKIKVLVNNVEVPQGTSNGWVFDSATNLIKFNGQAIPSHNDQVEISYE